MITVHGRRNSINVQKVMWAVGEIGLDHEQLNVGGMIGGNDTPAYRAMNPNGRVPVLEDGETVIQESHSCVRYLAARYDPGGLWPQDPAERSLADRWMDWELATAQPPMTVFWGLVRPPEANWDMQAILAAAEKLRPVWTILEDHLADHDFVAGSRFTMGDIPVGALYNRYTRLPEISRHVYLQRIPQHDSARLLYRANIPPPEIRRPALPNCDTWLARLVARPAFDAHVVMELT